MKKLNLTQKYKSYFNAKFHPEFVNIEEAQFLSIEGKGDPSGQDFNRRIQIIYSTAYTLKFAYKLMGKDFVVSKLEAQWWYDENKFNSITMEDAPLLIPRSEWAYRILIRIPEYITDSEVQKSINIVHSKKNMDLAKEISIFRMSEGLCVQMLHIGPFDTEAQTLTIMHEFIQRQNNLVKNGLHHEIYLSDFRRTSPENLKTILREPVKFFGGST